METKTCTEREQENPKAYVIEDLILKRRLNKMFGVPEDAPSIPSLWSSREPEFHIPEDKTFISSMRFNVATVALQGLLASGMDGSNSITHIVDRAIAYADEMIEQLKSKEI